MTTRSVYQTVACDRCGARILTDTRGPLSTDPNDHEDDCPSADARTEVEAHAPVIAGLRAHGVPAFEEATGGNNYHVCYPHPSGGYILADANLGYWVAGVYVKPAGAGEDDDEWRWSPAEMHDSALAGDADPALVVAWLLETVMTAMSRFEALVARQRALRAQIEARADAVPNLRDFGLARRADYERALAAYHAETARLWDELHAVARARMAAR